MSEADVPVTPSESLERSVGSLLVALAGVDDTIEGLQRSTSVLRECVDAGLSCVRAAHTLIQEHSNWWTAVTRDSARSELGAERTRQIAEGTAIADERVSGLLELYVDCARPVKAAVDTLNAELARVEATRDALVQKLPAELAQRRKLLQESARPPYICAVLQGRCTGCNMQLPTLFAQKLQHAGSDCCPSCRRILCVDLTNLQRATVSTEALPTVATTGGRRDGS